MKISDFETDKEYEFRHSVSEKALDTMVNSGLSIQEMKELDEQFIAGAGEIFHPYITDGSFRLWMGKICFFQKRFNGRTKDDVYRAYCKLEGDCYYCKHPRSMHRVVESKIEDGWTIRCPITF